jgi:hypothetical protein
MPNRYALYPEQPGTLLQDPGSSRCYRVILLVDQATGSEVIVRVEATLDAVDAAFAFVAPAIRAALGHNVEPPPPFIPAGYF